MITLLLLNSYPVLAAESLVINAKRSDMTARADLLSAAISTLPGMTTGEIETMADYLGLSQKSGRFLVTGAFGEIIYDSTRINSQVGRVFLFPEIAAALKGNDAFYCRYEDGAFVSRAASPVMLGEDILGAVCFYDYDTEQAEFLMNICRYTRNISIVIAAAATLCIALTSTLLGKKIGKLLDGIALVREGKYDQPIEISGKDEFTVVSSEFNDLADRLLKTEQVRREFVSDASHELKTPLASIKLLSDSIIQAENIDPADTKEFLSDISEEIDRLTRITEKLLTLTRLDTQVHQQPERVDLADAACRAVRLLAPLAEKAAVSVHCDFCEEAFICADADGAYQMVFNLIENAIKYNKTGGTVRINLYKEEGLIVFSVENTGEGIPEKDLPRVFDRFYRVDKARSRETGGTGLGLSIVKQWVEQFGGDISVQSAQKTSTVFTLKFPTGGESPCPEK